MPGWLMAIGRRIWPELDTLQGLQRASLLGDILGLATVTPFALVGLVWLAARTDPDVIQQEWLALLVLAGVGLAFGWLTFTLSVEIKSGLFAHADGDLSNIIVWSVALIFGPTGLWLPILWHLVQVLYLWQRRSAVFNRTNIARNTSHQVALDSFASLVALALYEAWGGDYPPAALTAEKLIPALVAVLIRVVLGGLLLLPYMLYISTVILKQIDSALSLWGVLRYTAVVVTVPSLVDPFAVLAAGLYSQHGWGVFGYLIAGTFLAGLLANQLSRAVTRSQLRSREVECLEALSRGIISAPLDASTLPDLLAAHIPGMFRDSGLEIRLFGPETDRVLFHSERMTAVDPAVWAWGLAQGTLQVCDGKKPPPWAAAGATLFRQIGQLYVPIQSQDDGALLGGLFLVRIDAPRTIHEMVPAAQSLASQIALALHRAKTHAQILAHQKVEQELALAGDIQARFLPRDLPDILGALAGWDIAAVLEPARRTSGDFYDLITLPNGQIGIVVADVADKGMGAALFMALSCTLIRTYALEYSTLPARVLAAANRRIVTETATDLFVTVFFGVLDPATGTLTYCNAGHNPPYLLAATRPLQTLARTGIPLGLFDDHEWQEQALQLEPGDVLILYSDGVTEAENGSGGWFGDERLIAAATAQPGGTATAISEAVLGEIHAFVGDTAPSDDITLMVVIRQ